MNDITAVAPRQNRFSWRALSPWLISAAVLLILPFVLDSGTAFTLMNVIAVNIVFALSYNMLLGQGCLNHTDAARALRSTSISAAMLHGDGEPA